MLVIVYATFTQQANFGHVRIPADFTAPSHHTIQQPLGYNPLVHLVEADSVQILDTRRIQINNLIYDGQGPGKDEDHVMYKSTVLNITMIFCRPICVCWFANNTFIFDSNAFKKIFCWFQKR